ncbi:GhoT/OrtT family toxin [Escherichia coli]|nr:GhoT/OrtT family toxin [Escherichia coli]
MMTTSFIVYILFGIVFGFITFKISVDTFFYRLLSGLLIGVTWPMSFPVVLITMLF